MMAGLTIENTEAIILDAKNNSYDGPRGLFKIVVDQFDGKTINSWHIEDKYGEKSRNLGSDKCESLDAIVGQVGTYIGRFLLVMTYKSAIQILNWTKPKYVNELIRENQRLKALVEKTKK
jgi:hypothetical protein